MIWDYFAIFAILAVISWATGALAAWKGKRMLSVVATATGIAILLSFIITIWITLERPPLRTMGETRLWYSLFLPLAGLFVYIRRRYKWILSFTTLLATVFVCVNIFKPEIHTKALMPALQSPWFAPHVIVYMMAYALLGAATLMAAFSLIKRQRQTDVAARSEFGYELDGIVRTGLAFLTFGMLFGAMWAKEAWGHYWTWDPKETWAAVTWLGYLLYIHYRLLPGHNTRLALWLLIADFILLQMCWWGINYLPSAQGASVHTY